MRACELLPIPLLLATTLACSSTGSGVTIEADTSPTQGGGNGHVQLEVAGAGNVAVLGFIEHRGHRLDLIGGIEAFDARGMTVIYQGRAIKLDYKNISAQLTDWRVP